MDVLKTVLLVLVCSLYGGFGHGADSHVHYINEWAAQIEGGKEVAKRVAEQNGYIVERELSGFEDHYLLKRSDVPHRSRRSAEHHTKRIAEDHRVLFVEQQHEKVRVKRGVTQGRDMALEIVQRGEKLSDPNFKTEWYLNQADDAKATSKRSSSSHADLRVTQCWKMGLTGKGVVLTILDDGIESNHTDLADSYDPDASYDFNDNDGDPFPRYDPTNENKHGTRCAGEISMAANNNKCGVGIAFNAKVGGVRMLDGRVTDRVEAESLAFNRQHIDIYSASWGPNDDGKTTEKPGRLVSKALIDGVQNGRGGKGSIFMWASGNGGVSQDNCNSDGYASSIYTVSISSASQFGNSPWYSEKCSSTIATAFSSGTYGEGYVTSADLHNMCTTQHSGTSAAAPMAAAMVALLLEANPNLTWRDVQHILVHTSRMEPLALERGWYKNGAGYCVNLRFGFGLMDASAMVNLADPKKWINVGPQNSCEVSKDGLNLSFKSGTFVEVEINTDGCNGQKNEVNYLEHVVLVINLNHTRRGHIFAELESPIGTVTTLMLERRLDASTKGFKEWPLVSTHNWGEQPQGTWKFRVADRGDSSEGMLQDVKLVMYGTKDKPPYQNDGPKDCGNVEKFADIYSHGDEGLKDSLRKMYNKIEEDSESSDLLKDTLKSLLNSPNRDKNPHVQNTIDVLQDMLENKNITPERKMEVESWYGGDSMFSKAFSFLYRNVRENTR